MCLCRDVLGDGTRAPGLGRRIALDIARGLHFLHARRIVHNDLKSANILLARDQTAKIADVGLAKIMRRDFLSTLFHVGTFAWAAPEVGAQLQDCLVMLQRAKTALQLYSEQLADCLSAQDTGASLLLLLL